MQLLIAFGILCSTLVTLGASTCPAVIPRAKWGATAPTNVSYLEGKPSIIVIREHGTNCFSRRRCFERVQDIQSRDMLVKGMSDIVCSFIIGDDGVVYEGRGWSKVVMDKNTLVVCMMGSYNQKLPPDSQKNTMQDFLSCPNTQSKLDSDYTLTALRDLMPDSHNPGKFLYEIVQKLPRYTMIPHSK